MGLPRGFDPRAESYWTRQMPSQVLCLKRAKTNSEVGDEFPERVLDVHAGAEEVLANADFRDDVPLSVRPERS